MTGFLLDTHSLIWFLNGDKAISSRARKTIENNANANFVSIATLWEISIKISIGKLELNTTLTSVLKYLDINGFQLLPVKIEDTVLLSTLPFFHRDPFDRMLICQSITNQFPIITKDASFAPYKIETIW